MGHDECVVRRISGSRRRAAGVLLAVLLGGVLIAGCSTPQSSTAPGPTPSAGHHVDRCLLIAEPNASTGIEVSAVVRDDVRLGRPRGESRASCSLLGAGGSGDHEFSISLTRESIDRFKADQVDQWLDATGDQQIYSHAFTHGVEMYGGLTGDRLIYAAAGDGRPFRRFVEQSGVVRTSCSAPGELRCEDEWAEVLATLRVRSGVPFVPPGSGPAQPPIGYVSSSCDMTGTRGTSQVTLYLSRRWRPLDAGLSKARSQGASACVFGPRGRDTGTARLEVRLTDQSLSDFSGSMDRSAIHLDDESIRFTSRYLSGREGYVFSFVAGRGSARYRLFAAQVGDVRVTCTEKWGGRTCGEFRRRSLPTMRISSTE